MNPAAIGTIIAFGSQLAGLIGSFRQLVTDAKAVAGAEDQERLNEVLRHLNDEREAAVAEADSALDEAADDQD